MPFQKTITNRLWYFLASKPPNYAITVKHPDSGYKTNATSCQLRLSLSEGSPPFHSRLSCNPPSSLDIQAEALDAAHMAFRWSLRAIQSALRAGTGFSGTSGKSILPAWRGANEEQKKQFSENII